MISKTRLETVGCSLTQSRKATDMKVTLRDRDTIARLIRPLDTEHNRECYRQGNFPRAEFVEDLNARYRWDLFWASKAIRSISNEYKDSHIYTALRAIVKEL